jgi:hypothetical protein
MLSDLEILAFIYTKIYCTLQEILLLAAIFLHRHSNIVDKNIHIAATYLSCCYKLVYFSTITLSLKKILIPTIIIIISVAANCIVFLQQTL